MNPQEYVGTPYASLDCFALVRKVALECFGLRYPALEEYNPKPERVVFNELQTGNWINIDYADRRGGDVITLSPHSGTPGHVGIILADLWVLHNDKKYGCIIQNDAGLRRRGFLYRKVYRWLA
jgi:hypothetical protein